VREADTGRDVETDDLHVGGQWIGRSSDGVYAFECTPGRAEIRCREPGVQLESTEIDVISGLNELTLTARLSCGLHLSVFEPRTFRSADPRLVTIRIHREESADPPVAVECPMGDGVSVPLDSRGRYVIVVDVPEGYGPVDAQSVDVVPGRWMRRAITLLPSDLGDREEK
jgi:hypothetical protein